MGLFNFLYKLTNIFSNKRKLKVFIILGIILFIVFSWSSGVFATSPTDADALTNYQLALQQAIFSQLTDMVKMGQFIPSNNTNFINNIKENFVYLQPSVNENAQMIIHLYRLNRNDNGTIRNTPQDFTIDGSWSVTNTGTTASTEYQCKLAQFWGPSSVYYYGRPPTITTPQFISFYLPDACFCVRSTAINDFLSACNEVSELPPTYNTSDAELQAITRSGFNNLNNTLQTQTQTMTNSINSASTSITNSVDNLTNTIEDTTTDDSQVEFAEDNNQDITSGFFTGLYDSFENAFVNTDYKFVSFPIPFTGKVITFSSSYVLNNIKRNEKFSVLVTLAESFWWFALGYFVILDIYKKINAIKSGDLTNIENDNITTDLL